MPEFGLSMPYGTCKKRLVDVSLFSLVRRSSKKVVFLGAIFHNLQLLMDCSSGISKHQDPMAYVLGDLKKAFYEIPRRYPLSLK